MLMQQLLSALVALLPVIVFLAALLWLDSYKLLAPSSVMAVIGGGAVMAAVSYPLNAFLLGRLDIGLPAFSRYIAPLTEELLKGLIVLALVRMHRIGFLVDAAIYGFAVGAGFALAENLYYLHLAAEAGMGTWIVRGFGTALMHGGTTALFAVMGLARVERAAHARAAHFVPGFVVAALLHSGFNHLGHLPLPEQLRVARGGVQLDRVERRRGGGRCGGWRLSVGRVELRLELVERQERLGVDRPGGEGLGSGRARRRGG
jgi:RsiW-degrading membrane proteinase PrsW (M82 family)